MTVFIFMFTNIILLFFIKLFVVPNPFVKYVILCICIFILYILKTYPRTRFKQLSKLRSYKLSKLTKYRFENKWNHIYNILILIIFTITFPCLIFILRYFNKEKVIDLKNVYNIFYDLYIKTPVIDSFINIIILLLIFIIYIYFFLRLVKYYKYHLIKRHLYLVGDLTEGNKWYVFILYYKIFNPIIIHNLYFNLVFKLHMYCKKYYYYNYYNKKNNNNVAKFEELSFDESFAVSKAFRGDIFFYLYKESSIFFILITKWHYLLMLILIIYDIFFNNMIITHIFYVLPWVFFFEIYLRFSNFIEGLWIPHDQYLHTILYAKQLEIWDKDTLYIDGDFYDYNNAKNIYKTYVARDFKKDPNYI